MLNQIVITVAAAPDAVETAADLILMLLTETVCTALRAETGHKNDTTPGTVMRCTNRDHCGVPAKQGFCTASAPPKRAAKTKSDCLYLTDQKTPLHHFCTAGNEALK